MQAFANISQFESLQNSANVGQSNLRVFNPVENAIDVSSNPNGTVSSGVAPVKPVTAIPKDLPPPIQEWGNSVNARLDRLESDVKSIKTDVAEIKQAVTRR